MACGLSSLELSRPRSRLVCRSFPSLWPALAGFCATALTCLGRRALPSRFRRRSIQALLHARVILPILPTGTNSFACVTPHVPRLCASPASRCCRLEIGGWTLRRESQNPQPLVKQTHRDAAPNSGSSLNLWPTRQHLFCV